MVSKCIVCKIASKPGNNVMFHRFPTNSEKRKRWFTILGCEANPVSWRICSKHFKLEDYTSAIVSGKPRLRDSAEPSLHLKKPLSVDDVHENKEHDIINEIATEIEISDTGPKQNLCTPSDQLVHDHDYTRNVPICKKTLSSKRLSDEWADFCDDDEFMNYKRLKDVRWDKVANCPKKTTLCWDVAMEVIEEQQNKIKKLRSQVHSLKNKTTNLQALTEHLNSKNLISLSQAKTVKKSVCKVGSMLLTKMLDGKRKFKECPGRLKTFASTLYFISPTAYDYVRAELVPCLPSPSTIRSWHQKIDETPGISTLALQALKRKVKEEEREERKLLYLEMEDTVRKKRKGTQRDGNKVVGYVDLGLVNGEKCNE